MKKNIFVLMACIGLTACGGAKEQLGLNKQVPDEFKVITRAPLQMPPDYSLRPPAPGTPRPQEQSTIDAASEAVFGEAAQGSSGVSSGENALLQAAGGNAVSPDIRAKIDAEALEYSDSNKPVVDRLLNLTKGQKEVAAEIVDAKAERERIENNEAAGKPVTAGETPSIED
ncbi:MAG: DUF3035 domain-containing protein [Alphaproteobacteria bacterium]